MSTDKDMPTDEAGVGSSDAVAPSPLEASPTRPPGLPPTKAAEPVDAKSFRERGLNAGIEAAAQLFASAKKERSAVADDQERWLLRIHGVDYGPFDGPTVRAKLEAEEVDEHSVVTDSFSGELFELLDAPHFTDFVFDYIPRRERRRLEAEQRKQELVEEVKMRSVRATFSVALGAILLSAVGLMGLHFSGVLAFRDLLETVRPTPLEFPFDQVVRTYRFRFEVPEPEYQAIAADQALVAALFAEKPASSGRSRSARSGGGGNLRFDAEGSNSDYVLDFDSSQPARKLSTAEVNGTISQNASRISACFQDELRNNANFKGATLRFSINPSGQTFSVRASTEGGRMSSTAENCLVRAVRSMRFPQFNDVPMSVSYPFYVR